MDNTFFISAEEPALSLSFNVADGTTRIDAPEHSWLLSPGRGMELLQWFYERRNTLYRATNELPEEQLPDWAQDSQG